MLIQALFFLLPWGYTQFHHVKTGQGEDNLKEQAPKDIGIHVKVLKQKETSPRKPKKTIYMIKFETDFCHVL